MKESKQYIYIYIYIYIYLKESNKKYLKESKKDKKIFEGKQKKKKKMQESKIIWRKVKTLKGKQSHF